jgi:Fur family ferric uptake transcriptional regulator
MIIDAITHSQDHMSADEIFEFVQERTQATNIATVYRTLEMLWEEGFAQRNDLGGGKFVYATNKHGPHTHLVCRQCNRVVDADPDVFKPIQESLQSKYHFTADIQHLSVFGECADCKKSPKER